MQVTAAEPDIPTMASSQADAATWSLQTLTLRSVSFSHLQVQNHACKLQGMPISRRTILYYYSSIDRSSDISFHTTVRDGRRTCDYCIENAKAIQLLMVQAAGATGKAAGQAARSFADWMVRRQSLLRGRPAAAPADPAGRLDAAVSWRPCKGSSVVVRRSGSCLRVHCPPLLR